MHKAPLYIYIYICVRGSLCRSLFLSLSITHIHTLSVSHPVSVCARARDPDASLAVSLCGRAILTDADGQVKAYAESPQFRAGIRARNRFSALGVGGASAGGNLFRGGLLALMLLLLAQARCGGLLLVVRGRRWRCRASWTGASSDISSRVFVCNHIYLSRSLSLNIYYVDR